MPPTRLATASVLRPSSGVKLAAAVWAYLTGQAKASETCPTSILVKENDEVASSFRPVMVLVVFCLLIGFAIGWVLRTWYDEKKQKPTVMMLTKSTQSQTRYTYATENPRFVPLGDRDHGCWELAR